METILKKYNRAFIHTGNIFEDVLNTFKKYELDIIFDHTKRVVDQSEVLAKRFAYDTSLAKKAALLHDVSGVIKNEYRIEVCYLSNISLIEEEISFPMISHQKISRVIASEIYNETHEAVLSAIECHTTLKGNPSKLDLILFVADKMAWDQPGKPPYLDKMTSALEESLEESALVYIDYLLDNKANLKVIHPWLLEAKHYLDTN